MTTPGPGKSCAFTRQFSLRFADIAYASLGWISGESPTCRAGTMDTRARPRVSMRVRRAMPYRTTAAVWPNRILRSSSVRLTGWPKFGLTSFALA